MTNTNNMTRKIELSGTGWRIRRRKRDGALVPLPTQKCGECGAWMEPEFKSDVRDAETWFWPDCLVCQGPCCAKCSDEVYEEGFRACLTCLQNPDLESQVASMRRW
jgi:hypothetical protein